MQLIVMYSVMFMWNLSSMHGMLAIFFAVHAGAAMLSSSLGFWCQLGTWTWCSCVAAYMVSLRREWRREFQFRLSRSDRGCPSNLREPALHPKKKLANTYREARIEEQRLQASDQPSRHKRRAVALWRTVRDQLRRQGPDVFQDPPKLRSFSTFSERRQFRASYVSNVSAGDVSDADSWDHDATVDDSGLLVDRFPQPIDLATSSMAESGPPACPFNKNPANDAALFKFTVTEDVEMRFRGSLASLLAPCSRGTGMPRTPAKAKAKGENGVSLGKAPTVSRAKLQQAWGSEFIHRASSSSSTPPSSPLESRCRAASMAPLGAARSHKLDMK